MKKMKKFLALLIAMAMVLGMGTTVFATGDTSSYTITVNGAIKDATYAAYRVFDVTYDTEDTSKVNYKIISGHDVSTIEGFSSVFKTTGTGTTKYVERASSSVTDEQIINWLKGHEAAIKSTCEKAKEVTNTAGTDAVTLDVRSPGYYFIASTLGNKAAVTIDTAHPTATVNSKIQDGPSTDDEAKKIKIGEELVDVADLQPGTDVNFQVVFNASNYAVDANGKQTVILNYVVEDAPSGFDIKENTVAITLDGDQTAPTFTKTVTDGKLTVTIPWGTKTGEGDSAVLTPATYNNPTKVTVTYTATLTAVTKATNKAIISYNDTNKFGDDETEVYNHIVEVEKVDSDSTTKKLPGAQFAVKNKDGKYYKLTETTTGSETPSGDDTPTGDDTQTGDDTPTGEGGNVTTKYAVTWVDNLADATTYWTSTDGTNEGTVYQQIQFKGLEPGTYTLVEITAPKGYNLAADKEFPVTAPEGEVTDTSVLTVSVTAEDRVGSVLPSTGGIGTTIFYIVGGILVVGAGVVLITRRRMDVQ
jgi:LPXTG-motif cell wall-anchored protein